jgi:signal transduction histidine kinase/ligand-binding sensor domain-containing protein
LIFRNAILLAACLLSLFARPAFGSSDDWFARIWQTDDGLPDNVISGLAQTPDGFLWVGTQGGLMRFDGTQFQEFSPVNIADVPNRVVRALICDRRGALWIAIDRGMIITVAGDQSRLFTEKDGLPDSFVREMIEDADGAIWISYYGYNRLCRIKDNQVVLFGVAEGLPAPGPCWLTCDNQRQLWFAKGNELGVFRDSKFTTLVKLDASAARIAGSHSGGVWIGTATQLLKYQEGGKVELKGTLPQPGTEPGVIHEDRAGMVWIGSEAANGLFKFDGSSFETVHTSHPSINCLMEDQEGNLWVGTGGGGLNRLRPRILELSNVDPARPIDSVRSVCEDAEGSLWAVTRDGLLMHHSVTNWVNMLQATNWPGGRAACVAAGSNGAVWIGGRGFGLYRFQNNRFTAWGRANGLASETVRSLLASSDGDVWLGIDTPRQVQQLHDGKFTSFKMPPGARTIRAMAEDSRGNIWVGTAEGQLLRITGNQLINETTNGPPQPFAIRCLHATADGAVWIGYAGGGGLGRFKNGKYSRFTPAQGLDDNFVSQIVSDQQGWLWLAGTHGFYRVQMKQLDDVAEGRARQVRSVKFGRGEGLPSLQANYDNYPAALLGSDDRPRIGTRTGLAVIHTENIRDNPDPPQVFVDRASVDGEIIGLYNSRSPLRERAANDVADLKTQAMLRVPPGHHRIEFDFVAPSLTAPENVQFRYRLEGFDEGWLDAGDARKAIYSRLPAAGYHFRVIACNQSGVWNEIGATVNLTVLPFFWQTWWFRFVMFAAFTVSIIAIVRYVSFRRLRGQLRAIEQQAALDEERARIARDLHDDLGGSLTQVALLLDTPQEKSAALDEHVQHCAAMVRQVVKAVDGIIWAINPRNDTLPYLIDYISEFAVEFLQAAEIRCRVELPDDLPDRQVSPEARHNLFLVVKQALNNIACHAHATEVWLRVAFKDGKIEIEIKDNGRGFVATPNPRANGLRNMRQRMEEIGGTFSVDSKPGEGTKISAAYPLPPSS